MLQKILLLRDHLIDKQKEIDSLTQLVLEIDKKREEYFQIKILVEVVDIISEKPDRIYLKIKAPLMKEKEKPIYILSYPSDQVKDLIKEDIKKEFKGVFTGCMFLKEDQCYFKIQDYKAYSSFKYLRLLRRAELKYLKSQQNTNNETK